MEGVDRVGVGVNTWGGGGTHIFFFTLAQFIDKTSNSCDTLQRHLLVTEAY